MFGFLKKYTKNEESKAKEENFLTEEERKVIVNKIKDREGVLNSLTERVEKAKVHEQLGLLYAELEESEKAIENLEKSLEEKLSMGDGYKKLMSLYNSKRAEAARNRDNEGIDYYMSKMDDMRNIAKKVTLSR